MPKNHQIEFVRLVLSTSVVKSSFLGLVFSMSGAKAKKISNRVSWGWFCRLLEPRLESHQIEPPGIRFVDCWSQWQKFIKSRLLGLVWSTSGAEARKSLKQTSWDRFSRLLESRPEKCSGFLSIRYREFLELRLRPDQISHYHTAYTDRYHRG